MKVKTLKEIREKVYSQCRDEAEERLLEYLFRLEDEEAVKWVKKDRKEINGELYDEIEKRWMKRLNITEEDLK